MLQSLHTRTRSISSFLLRRWNYALLRLCGMHILNGPKTLLVETFHQSSCQTIYGMLYSKLSRKFRSYTQNRVLFAVRSTSSPSKARWAFCGLQNVENEWELPPASSCKSCWNLCHWNLFCRLFCEKVSCDGLFLFVNRDFQRFFCHAASL